VSAAPMLGRAGSELCVRGERASQDVAEHCVTCLQQALWRPFIGREGSQSLTGRGRIVRQGGVACLQQALWRPSIDREGCVASSWEPVERGNGGREVQAAHPVYHPLEVCGNCKSGWVSQQHTGPATGHAQARGTHRGRGEAVHFCMRRVDAREREVGRLGEGRGALLPQQGGAACG